MLCRRHQSLTSAHAGQAAVALGRDRQVRPGPRQSNSGPRAQGTQVPVQGPRCADSSSAGLAKPSAIFSAWQQSLSGVKLAQKNPIPKKLRSVVRFAFHQIVLANSIQNLLSDPRLTDAIDDDPRNHFRTPISGTTRLARRAAVHQYGHAAPGSASHAGALGG